MTDTVHASEPAPATLARTTLIVTDVERALAFYALLGFTVEMEMGGARDPAATNFPLNAPSTRSRLLILGSAAGGGKLGLLAFDAPAPAEVRPPRDRLGRGDAVLVLDVADALAVHAKLAAAGAKLVAPPQVYRSRRTDAQGRPLEGRVFHAFDPDGNLVELLEAPRPRD
ncbi:MAG: VOC family protein [Steroidobacteraceae bacterium]|jgi:catechol 2,3-dioxygenase-like lactoylglutathione lyase family enzyme|nr:VOC family protein [Steroidobacteraceae bacterium]